MFYDAIKVTKMMDGVYEMQEPFNGTTVTFQTSYERRNQWSTFDLDQLE